MKTPSTTKTFEHIVETKLNCQLISDKLRELQATFSIPQNQANTERKLKLVVNN